MRPGVLAKSLGERNLPADPDRGSSVSKSQARLKALYGRLRDGFGRSRYGPSAIVTQGRVTQVTEGLPGQGYDFGGRKRALEPELHDRH